MANETRPNVCRLCLKVVEAKASCIPITNNSVVLQNLNLISFATIRNLQLTEEPVLCETCVEKLKQLACFKENVITNEFKIQCHQKRDVNFFLQTLSSDIDKICRLCLKITTDQYAKPWKNTKKLLVKCNIHLNLNITKPSKMCEECHKMLEETYHFVCSSLEKEKFIVSSYGAKKKILEGNDLLTVFQSLPKSENGQITKQDSPERSCIAENNNNLEDDTKFDSNTNPKLIDVKIHGDTVVIENNIIEDKSIEGESEKKTDDKVEENTSEEKKSIKPNENEEVPELECNTGELGSTEKELLEILEGKDTDTELSTRNEVFAENQKQETEIVDLEDSDVQKMENNSLLAEKSKETNTKGTDDLNQVESENAKCKRRQVNRDWSFLEAADQDLSNILGKVIEDTNKEVEKSNSSQILTDDDNNDAIKGRQELIDVLEGNLSHETPQTGAKSPEQDVGESKLAESNTVGIKTRKKATQTQTIDVNTEKTPKRASPRKPNNGIKTQSDVKKKIPAKIKKNQQTPTLNERKRKAPEPNTKPRTRSSKISTVEENKPENEPAQKKRRTKDKENLATAENVENQKDKSGNDAGSDSSSNVPSAESSETTPGNNKKPHGFKTPVNGLRIIRRTKRSNSEAEKKWLELISGSSSSSSTSNDKNYSDGSVESPEKRQSDTAKTTTRKRKIRESYPVVEFVDIDQEPTTPAPIQTNEGPKKYYEKSIVCDRCPYRTKSNDMLIQHQLIHKLLDGVKKFRCKVCSFQAKSQELLDQHKVTHFDIKVTFKCVYCDYKSKKKVSLMHHITKHADKPVNQEFFCRFVNCDESDECFECLQCEHQSPDRDAMISHVESHKSTTKFHASIEMFKCGFCSYKTKTSDTLARHESLHQLPNYKKLNDDGDTLLKCELCPFATINKRSLRNHVSRKHVEQKTKRPRQKGEMLFSCEQCSYVTDRKPYLSRHILVHMTKKNVEFLECQYCLFETKHRRSYVRHMAYVHNVSV